MMIDEETRLDRVTIDGMRMIYEYTLVSDAEPELDVEDFREFAALVLRDKACSGDLSRYIDSGVSVTFQYAARDGQLIMAHEFDKQICSRPAPVFNDDPFAQ